MTAAEPKPFRILGVQQVALGHADKSELGRLWVDLFGARRISEFRSERENVDEDVTVLGRGSGRVEIDLMQPLDPEKKPRVHEPPLNHIGLWVDDLRAAVEWLTGRGVRFAPGGVRPGASGYDVCFIHPKANADFPIAGCGVLIELVQAPTDVIAAFDSASD
ncbi:MAG: VOC family protein [Polyangiaceae bacterium]